MTALTSQSECYDIAHKKVFFNTDLIIGYGQYPSHPFQVSTLFTFSQLDRPLHCLPMHLHPPGGRSHMVYKYIVRGPFP